MTPKYDITVRPGDGNAFSILSAARRALVQAEREDQAPKGTAEEYLTEATAGNYDHLIQTTLKYVNLTV